MRWFICHGLRLASMRGWAGRRGFGLVSLLGTESARECDSEAVPWLGFDGAASR